jgi:hypothetical protein
MESHRSEWLCYILGAVLTLGYKLGRTIYFERKQGKQISAILCEWFFAPTLENVTSWTATVGGVWVVGSVYIERFGFPNLEWLVAIPVVDSFAFFLGAIAEMSVPNFAKWIMKKMPGGS